jgi:hypothetical protein
VDIAGQVEAIEMAGQSPGRLKKFGAVAMLFIADVRMGRDDGAAKL